MDFESRIYALHCEAVASGKLLRNLVKRKVSRVDFEGVSYVVKAYRRKFLHKLFCVKPHSIKGSQLLDGLTPPVLADFIVGDWQINVYRDIGGPDLFDGANLADGAEAFADAGRLLAKIHEKRIFHADTKAPNFVVNNVLDGMPPVLIIDCDRVKKYSALPVERRAFNLAQFICCYQNYEEERLAPLVSTALSAYKEQAALDDAAFASLMKLALDIAKNNRHIEKKVSESFLRRFEK